MNEAIQIDDSEAEFVSGGNQYGPTPLTALDFVLGNTPVRRVLYYDKPLAVDELIRGLKETLSLYPIMEGRIRMGDGRYAIEGGADGIGFKRVDVEGSMPEYGINAKPHKKQLYVPDLDLSKIMQGKAPLFLVQVTNFNNGCIIGLCTSHLLVDGGTFWRFVLDWARLMNGEPVAELPDMNRSAVYGLAEGEGKHPSASTRLVTLNLKAKLRMVVSLLRGLTSNTSRTWHFDQEAIETLKSSGAPVSRFDLIGGLLLKLLGTGRAAQDSIGLTSVYDLRMLDLLPINAAYIGNAAVTREGAFSRQELEGTSIGETAVRIRGLKGQLVEGELRQDLAFFQREVAEGKVSEGGRLTGPMNQAIFNTLAGNTFGYNVWAFPMYEFSIQGNTAVWYDFVEAGIFRAMNIIFVLPAPQGGLLVKVMTRKSYIKTLEQALGIRNAKPRIEALKTLVTA